MQFEGSFKQPVPLEKVQLFRYQMHPAVSVHDLHAEKELHVGLTVEGWGTGEHHCLGAPCTIAIVQPLSLQIHWEFAVQEGQSRFLPHPLKSANRSVIVEATVALSSPTTNGKFVSARQAKIERCMVLK